MKIIQIGNEIRHELGCAASLTLRGYDVTYFHVGEENLPYSKKLVYVDNENVEVPFLSIKSPTLLKSITSASIFIPSELHDEHFDLVITTPSTPFYIAHYFAKKQNVPLVLRVWGIRAFTSIERIVIGKTYGEITLMVPSLIHSCIQSYLSNMTVFLDNYTFNSFKRFLPNNKSCIIYPTYASVRDYSKGTEYNKVIQEIGKDYILGVVSSSRKGASFRIRDLPQLKILYSIARYNPDINVVVVGTYKDEAEKILNLKIPPNLYFLGYIKSDILLESLYKKAALVIVAPVLKSLSNRLLEAFYYGRPVIVNSNALLLYPELQHYNCLFISDNFEEYPHIVKLLLKDRFALKKLSENIKMAYTSLFSARKCGLAMKYIIESLSLGRS